MGKWSARALAAPGVVVLLVTAAACGGGGGGANGDGTAGAEGGGGRLEGDPELCTEDRVGGEATVLTGGVFNGLDPHTMLGSGVYGGDLADVFYDSLIRYHQPTDTYSPGLAESWEPSEDRSTWTLHLRDDATFGNGDPFTAEHVAAHFERMASSRSHGNLAGLVSDVEIVSDYELVVTMAGPFNFPYLVATELGWVPNMHLVEERGDEFHVNPVGAGAGAFELESMSDTAGESMVFTAKDDWWGGPVCLERIEFRYVPDTLAAAESFLNDEVDALMVNEIEQAAEIEEAGLLRFRLDAGTMTYITANQGIGGAEETPFQDVRVREALQFAINYEAMNERLQDGLDPATTSALFPESSPLYQGLQGPPYDPERAEELVQETVDDGVWDGSFTYLHSPIPHVADQAVLLEAMWEAVGMDVTLESDPSAAQRVIVEGDFEVANLGFGIVPPQPWATMDGLTCDSPRQRSGFCDPDMDAALLALREAVTLDETREALAEVQEVWNRTFPLVVSGHGVWGVGVHEGLKGVAFGADGAPLYSRAWLDD